MAGDEDKKKKKKSKKAEEAPPPEPEPEPEQAPAGGMDDDADDWLNAAAEPDEAPAEQAPAAGGDEGDDWLSGAVEEGAPAAEGAMEGEEGAELPPQPKKKPKFFVHWNRRKPRFYDYNFDYGTNYYSSMVGYVDSKNAGTTSVPRRMAFAERGMVSSLERHRNPDTRTETLLHDIRSNIRSFETSQKIYAYGKK